MKQVYEWLFTGEAARRRWLWLGILVLVVIGLALTGNLREF
jgi:hypothetical protein